MNRRQKTTLAVCIIIILLIVLRETGTVDLNLYTSNIDCHSDAKWSNTSTTLIPNSELSSNWADEINIKCNFGGNIKNVPVTVLFDNEVTDIYHCPDVVVKITNFHPGAIWMPLFKSNDFEATATCTSSFALMRSQDGHPAQTQYQFNGQIKISGHITVWGISSYTNTLSLIKSRIVSTLQENAKGQLLH